MEDLGTLVLSSPRIPPYKHTQIGIVMEDLGTLVLSSPRIPPYKHTQIGTSHGRLEASARARLVTHLLA